LKVSNAGSESGREVRDEHGYALFHDPACRTRYAKNLKRELTRIPFIGVAADVRRLKSPCGRSQKKSEPPHVGCCKGTSFFPFAPSRKCRVTPNPIATRKPARNFSKPSPPPAKNSPTCP
jgi:hypothetical protein